MSEDMTVDEAVALAREEWDTVQALVVLADEVDRLHAMEAAIREDCWSDRDPHGTFERYLNAKATT